MDFTLLVEEITRQVCARLEAAESLPGGFQVTAPAVPVRSQSVLVALSQQGPITTPGFDYEAFVDSLSTVAKSAPVTFTVVASERYPCLSLLERLPAGAARLLPGAADWRAEVPRHQALVLPNAGVGVVAKLASLVADEAPVEAALHMLVAERPVLAGGDDVAALLEHGSARGVLDLLRSQVRTIQALGVHWVRTSELAARLASVLGARGSPAAAGGKAVVTQDDVRQLEGQKRVEYPAGSIVTSLAWETAQSLGIDIVVRES